MNPSRNLLLTLLVGTALTGLVVSAVQISRLLAFPETAIQQGELDLSGTWKIRFSDDAAASSPGTDDSHWCLISVPDATVPALASGADRPSTDCPKEAYPKERMRNATYWYRKVVSTPPGAKWLYPSLFLGNVKDEVWVYWDGVLIGAGRRSGAPFTFPLSQSQAAPGRHVLAAKVITAEASTPGIFHAYPRKIALGEYDRAVASAAIPRIQSNYTMIPALTNGIAFLLLLFLLLRTGSGTSRSLTILAYLAFSTAYSVIVNVTAPEHLFLKDAAFLGIPITVLAYANEVVAREGRKRQSRWILGFVSLGFCAGLLYTYFARMSTSFHETMPRYLAGVSIAYFFAIIAPEIHRVILRERSENLPRQLGTLLVLVSMLTYTFIDTLQGRAAFSFMRLSTSLVTLFIVLLAIEDHVTQQRELAFFGRYLRKGLKRLLSRNFKRATGGEKIFQGRKIPVLALDIEGHTKTTFGMPFGMKRVFQDLWFTIVDKVMENKTFMDKGMGDGSLYYFEEAEHGGGCRAALECVLRIRSDAIVTFDRELVAKLKDLLSKTPELELPAHRFLAQYEQKAGISFWSRKTRIRAVLAYGFADEGLWGLHEQGHYDIEGDLVTLTARLEKNAGPDEIIMTRHFHEALLREWPEASALFAIEWQMAELKGIGQHEFGLIRSSAWQLTEAA